MWRAFPYPLRRLIAALFIIYVLLMKALFRVGRQDTLTPTDKLGNLSFWGVPQLNLESYRLRVEGEVEAPLELNYHELLELSKVRRTVRMDCVGGFRNNSVMEGMSLREVLERASLLPRAGRAVFHCADGYYTSISLKDLLERDVFLASRVNDETIDRFGYPLRLAIPGKYGYKWAKWVVE